MALEIYTPLQNCLCAKEQHIQDGYFCQGTLVTGNNLGRVIRFHCFSLYFIHFYWVLLFYYLLLLFKKTKPKQLQGKMLLDSSSGVMSLGTEMPALTQKSSLPPDTEPHYTCQSANSQFSCFFFKTELKHLIKFKIEWPWEELF